MRLRGKMQRGCTAASYAVKWAKPQVMLWCWVHLLQRQFAHLRDRKMRKPS